MREPGYPPEDAKEAVEILSTLKWLYEADVMVGSDLARRRPRPVKVGAAR
jgi:hypothetical protein